MTEGEELATALAQLRTALGDLRTPLDTPSAAEARATARRVVEQLDDHLLPRVRQSAAPLLAVVGGSTGAGKSTLVNSLVGEQVTASGVLRPTTRAPVLVHHPDDAAWFTTDRVLPGLPRLTGQEGEGRALRLVAHAAVPRGLAVLDAPDIDSVAVENRVLGAELLGAADLWVFVTTAARYADAVPWDLLAEASRRRAVVAVVLNRVDPSAREAVTADLGRMLGDHGPADARLLVVPEAAEADGRLPATAVAELDLWLRAVVADADTRDRVVRRTVLGSVEDLVLTIPRLADAADEQVARVDRLRGAAETAHEQALRDLASATSDGSMLRGEVLARWQEFVGTGEVLRALEARVGGVRDRVVAFWRGRPAPEPVAQAVGSGLVDLVVDAAHGAAERTLETWSADPAGAALVAGVPGRSGGRLREEVAEAVREWQRGVLALVSTEGADRRGAARVLSLGVNGLGAALMIAIFAHTGGLTAAEVGVAGGAALLAQRLLEAVFGDEAVRRLTRTAHEDLVRRCERVLDGERARLTTPLDALDVPRGSGERLRAAGRALVEAARPLGAAPELPAALAPSAPEEQAGSAGPPDGEPQRPWWRRLWEG